MRSYPLRRSMHNSSPSDARASTGAETGPQRRHGRSCLPRSSSARLRFLPVVTVVEGQRPTLDPLVNEEEEEVEVTTDPFLDVPWWTLGRAAFAGKRETAPPVVAGMSSAAGDANDDLATILRRALMDLASALQEIERQLTSIPEDGSLPTRG